ncbi:hypothetical protein STANM309S_04771 [Streptomyces tanashiensis]
MWLIFCGRDTAAGTGERERPHEPRRALDPARRRENTGSGSRRPPGRTALLAPHGRPRRPACRRDVRGVLRRPRPHGSGPEPGDHDVRRRDRDLPARDPRHRAVVPGLLALLRRRRRRHPRVRRHQRHRDGRGPRRRRGALPGRSRRPEVRRPDHPRGDAADRDRRGRHADRLQPGAGDRVDVLAAGPVDGPARDAVHRSRRGLSARLLVPDRDLPRPGLRLRHLLDLRPRLRQDPLGVRERSGHRPLAARPLRRRPGRLDRPAGPSTPRASSGPPSWSRCPWSSP